LLIGEFDADLGPRRARPGLVAIEGHVGVREVADHHEAVPPSQLDHFVEERLLDARGRWIVRIIEDHQLRPRIQMLACVRDVR
jgi:hypothetical protein